MHERSDEDTDDGDEGTPGKDKAGAEVALRGVPVMYPKCLVLETSVKSLS